MRNPDTLPQAWNSALTFGLLTVPPVCVAASWLLWQIPWPTTLPAYAEQLPYWLAMRINDVMPQLLIDRADVYRQYLAHLPASLAPWLSGRFDAAALLGLLSGGFVAYYAAQPVSALRHISGRQLLVGRPAQRELKRLAKREGAVSGEGLALHPCFNWNLSLDRETRHILLVGSIGGGKTAIILPLIQAAIARGDRLVIYDNKGDFTSCLPHRTLFAPWDARSHAWDIGCDCRNAQDARELAARLIPEGTDPLWHTAARQILTAILIKLQTEHNTTWGWHTLYKLTCLPREDLMAIVQVYLPEARHVVDAPGKTAQSILVNFGAHMSLVADLAKAWGNHPPEKRFSFIKWLESTDPRQRVLVLQGSGKYAELARSYIQSIITLMSGHINSPDFPESRKRRLWFILDEFPQLGKLEQVAPLLEIGRSKGVRVVLGAQDMAQIKAIYGEHTASSWSSMIGTQIVVRVNAGETANFLAKEVIGYRTVDHTVIHEGERQTPMRQDVLVMEPSELQSELGPNRTGVNALLLGYGDAFIAHWPFTRAPKRYRPAVPAAWLKSRMEALPLPPGSAEAPPAEPAATVDLNNEPPLRSRLRLRPATAELLDMAYSGTVLTEAPEPLSALTRNATGGNHETR